MCGPCKTIADSHWLATSSNGWKEGTGTAKQVQWAAEPSVASVDRQLAFSANGAATYLIDGQPKHVSRYLGEGL